MVFCKTTPNQKSNGAYGSTCALGTTVRQDGYDAQVSCIQVQILWSSASKSKGAKHFLLVAWGTYDHLFCASTSEAHGGRWFHTALLRQNFLTLWLLSYMHIACLMVGSICFCCVYYTNWPYTDKKLSGTLAKTTHRRGSNCTELPAKKGLGAARQTWARSKPWELSPARGLGARELNQKLSNPRDDGQGQAGAHSSVAYGNQLVLF